VDFPDFWRLIAAVPVIFTAYFTFGITGFGSALINIPLLAHFLPLPLAVPMGMLLDFLASATTGMRFRRGVQKREIAMLVPFGLVGTLIGAWLLLRVPRESAMLVLGGLVAAYAIFQWYSPAARPIRGPWAGPFGFAGGLFGGWLGVGGPLFVIYLARRLTDPIQLKATVAAMFTLQTAIRIGAFIMAGLLLEPAVWLCAAALLPIMLAGLATGHYWHSRWPRERVVKAMNLLLIISGISLILRGIF